MNRKFENIKAGDLVTLIEGVDQVKSVATVARVTETMVVLEVAENDKGFIVTVGESPRYRKSDGERVGRGSWDSCCWDCIDLIPADNVSALKCKIESLTADSKGQLIEKLSGVQGLQLKRLLVDLKSEVNPKGVLRYECDRFGINRDRGIVMNVQWGLHQAVEHILLEECAKCHESDINWLSDLKIEYRSKNDCTKMWTVESLYCGNYSVTLTAGGVKINQCILDRESVSSITNIDSKLIPSYPRRTLSSVGLPRVSNCGKFRIVYEEVDLDSFSHGGFMMKIGNKLAKCFHEGFQSFLFGERVAVFSLNTEDPVDGIAAPCNTKVLKMNLRNTLP